MKPAVFLDRDGTMNEQMGYINHLSRFQLLPRTALAIRLLNEHRVPAVVVTNQSGLAKVETFRVECDCRKPKPGLLIRASQEMGLDLKRSYVIGDRWSDLKTAARCQAKGILVLTGYGQGELQYIGPQELLQPFHIALDLYEAVQWILHDLVGPKSLR